MALKKNELYSSLWKSCDALRGGMEPSQYKDYVLTLLFLKYISDRYKNDPFGAIVIPEGTSFDEISKLKNDKEVGDKLNKIIAKIAEENELKGVINIADFNDSDRLGSGREQVDKLTKLIGIFEKLNFENNRADGDDLLGDAYEFLMQKFATESGKSKGQFYTPAEVSRVLAKIIGITADTPQDKTVYDMACGSGSLLLKASDEAKNGLTIYGQEKEHSTHALARMNMILHNNPTAVIVSGNTLSNPEWKESDGSLKRFDFIVANPPFSDKNWTSGVNVNDDPFNRFELGTPPAKNGDFAFLLHMIKSLKTDGKGAIILPHGVLFRGNAEETLRRNIVKQGYIKGIIGLPANIFYGTGIPASILVIDKQNASTRKGIFMIDASQGFIKDGNKNRLRSSDVHRIVTTFNHQKEIPHYSRMVPLSEIEENGYNLNIPRYIESDNEEDLHDLEAHLQGGIPNRDIEALDRYWKAFPSLQEILFTPLREGYSQLLIQEEEVRNTILEHPEFAQFLRESLIPFNEWRDANDLTTLAVGDSPKSWIEELSNDLLERYDDNSLIDNYSIYQLLMDYWAETMQDDFYYIAEQGWEKCNAIRAVRRDNDNKLLEEIDIDLGRHQQYKAEVIPPKLIIQRFYKTEGEAVNTLQNRADEFKEASTNFLEEHSGEEGALEDISNKTEANELLISQYESAWNLLNADEYRRYEILKEKELNEERQLKDLQLLPELEALKNARGNITLKAVRDRCEETSNADEKAILTRYLTTDKTIKATRRDKNSLYNSAKLMIDEELDARKEEDYFREIWVITHYIDLLDEESAKRREANEARKRLLEKVLKHYSTLTLTEIKTLVVEDKWLATLKSSITAEIERITHYLTERIQLLERRYHTPLPVMTEELNDLETRVAEHLKKMGLEW